MDIWSMHSFSTKRLRSTRIDRNIFPPDGCQDAARIGCCLLERSIAVNGADAKQF
jgi:hypothetical protein